MKKKSTNINKKAYCSSLNKLLMLISSTSKISIFLILPDICLMKLFTHSSTNNTITHLTF